MDTSIFEKFNAKFDTTALASDASKPAGGPREFVEVPFGNYEVRITKLELGESKKSGDPQAKVWFKILNGEFKNQMIFMYQNLTTGFGIRRFSEFLGALTDDFETGFSDYVQFATLIDEIAKDIDGKYEYELAYTQNDRGFKEFEIVQRFDANGASPDDDDLPF